MEDSYLDSPLRGKYGESGLALEVDKLMQYLMPEIRGLQSTTAVLSPVSGTTLTTDLETITSLLLFKKIQEVFHYIFDLTVNACTLSVCTFTLGFKIKMKLCFR